MMAMVVDGASYVYWEGRACQAEKPSCHVVSPSRAQISQFCPGRSNLPRTETEDVHCVAAFFYMYKQEIILVNAINASYDS